MYLPLFRDYRHFLNIVAMIALLSGCSGIERSENERVRRRNCKGEYIYRNHDEYSSAITAPLHTPRAPYPWEGHHPRLTKDYFRCRGDAMSPPILDQSDPEHPTPLVDCEGSRRHGLPILRGQEGVYPILLDLLNYVQMQTGKRVVITCGHRCPAHNTYADPSKENKTSKHQIGAEVDFYVQGMEEKPLEIVELMMRFYRETVPYRGNKEFEGFQRVERIDPKISTQPWYNKEILIQLHLAQEGRDADNSHLHPYLTLQVRYDRESKERVAYEWKKANLGYPRG